MGRLSIGDIVHLAAPGVSACLPAIVTEVHPDDVIALVGFDGRGGARGGAEPRFSALIPHWDEIPHDALDTTSPSYHLREECPRGM